MDAAPIVGSRATAGGIEMIAAKMEVFVDRSGFVVKV
jgi:hypothetical protein